MNDSLQHDPVILSRLVRIVQMDQNLPHHLKLSWLIL